MHLLTFSALYTTVISLVLLFFTCIDRLFLEPAQQGSQDYDLSSIRWQLAAVIVSFPVFLCLSWLFGDSLWVGSPATQRLRKLDDRRIADLKTIQREIMNIIYEGRPWSERDEAPARPLPKTLDEVARRARVQRVSLGDPATGESYEYRVIDELHFELCAAFVLRREESRDVAWNHPSGRHCFSFDVRNPQGPSASGDDDPSEP